MNIVYTLIILCVLVLVHEFGHFAVAKMNGIYVEEFSIGMGPKVFSWGKGETVYSIRAFPIGGFVKMVGEDEASDNERAFCNKSILSRMAVTFAGPAMNFVFAIIFFMIAFMYFGSPASNGLIGQVYPDYPAAVAGLQAGDVLVTLDDTKINNWNDISAFMQNTQVGQQVAVGYQRDGELNSASVMLIANEDGNPVLGITQGVAKADFFASIKRGFATTVEFTVLMLSALWQMISGQMAVEVAGPVGMVSMVGEYADVGLMYLFLFAGVLSVNLGVMNLLPIPALDGSRLVFLLVEAIRRKPIDRDKEAMVNFVGFVLLMTLMLVVTFCDIERLIK
jgi:RIP metalloprotease RseP